MEEVVGQKRRCPFDRVVLARRGGPPTRIEPRRLTGFESPMSRSAVYAFAYTSSSAVVSPTQPAARTSLRNKARMSSQAISSAASCSRVASCVARAASRSATVGSWVVSVTTAAASSARISIAAFVAVLEGTLWVSRSNARASRGPNRSNGIGSPSVMGIANRPVLRASRTIE